MKNKSYKILLLALPLIALAWTVSAYDEPLSPLPISSVIVPVIVNPSNQVKRGGLAVDAFIARDKAYLQGSTIFIKNTVRGGASPSTAASTVNFGVALDHSVAVQVKDNVYVSDANKRLIYYTASGAGERLLCAEPTGKIIICP